MLQTRMKKGNEHHLLSSHFSIPTLHHKYYGISLHVE